jgi:hypothetical protein
MRSFKILTAALAVPLFLLMASSAPAMNRMADDPCTGDELHLEKGQHQPRLCYPKFEIPPHRTWADPVDEQAARCPGSSYMPNEGAWYYWTYRGEWVTWNGSYRAAPHKGSDDPDVSRHTFMVSPYYHNWSSWSWPVRTITVCAGAKVSALRAGAEDMIAPDSVVSLGGGDDVARGTPGDDVERGGDGDDKLRGGKGDDELLGGRGADDLWGGEGSDELFDDHGRDHLHGGPGNDRFSTRDGDRDVVDCGAGEDIAIGDPHDTFTHCEHVYTTAANTPDSPPIVG